MRPLSFYLSVLKKILTQTYMTPSRTNYLSTEKQAKERTFMAYCDNCGNYDEAYPNQLSIDGDYQPDLYYYWDAPLDEDYDWRAAFPLVDCMCEICFDIANSEKKIEWVCQ